MMALRLLWAWLTRPPENLYRNPGAGSLWLFPPPAPFEGDFAALQREVAKVFEGGDIRKPVRLSVWERAK